MKKQQYMIFLLLLGMFSFTSAIGQNVFQQSPQALLDGQIKAVCYSGFRSGQYPDRGAGAVDPSEAQILEDLKLLEQAEFKLIRQYDCGENASKVLKVMKNNNLNIKVLQGAWLKAELSNHQGCAWLASPIPTSELNANIRWNREELQRCIALAQAYPELIVAVNVGNEALVDWNDHKVATDSIIAYVKKVQQAVDQPVTVAENYEWWAAHGEALAATVDFVSIHIYPVWEGKDIAEALTYSIANINKVKQKLPQAHIVITEAGWPSVATEFEARVSADKQKQYYDKLMAYAAQSNITTFFFEAFDEDWKGDPNNPWGAEKHWGLFNIDRSPKVVVKAFFE